MYVLVLSKIFVKFFFKNPVIFLFVKPLDCCLYSINLTYTRLSYVCQYFFCIFFFIYIMLILKEFCICKGSYSKNLVNQPTLMSILSMALNGIEYVHKTPHSLDDFLYIISIYLLLPPILIFNIISFDGFLQTYSILVLTGPSIYLIFSWPCSQLIT